MHEESLFLAVLELPTTTERAAFLDSACGEDAALRGRIEQLLNADKQSTGILETTRRTDPASALPSNAVGSEFAGRFRLIRRIGVGGMGEVWEAEQFIPVRRLIALKVIRPGLDPAALLARFEFERQSLALMDHPNIARVFDAGVADGQPYLAMELVVGEAVTSYCDNRRLTIRQRLEIFVPICRAVQHAHQKGVIHRDLKPSNVLVTEVDGKPMPKVIDFGIAKAAVQGLAGDFTPTGHGAVIGTAEYMAPEQAGGASDVDTRADVYALGVLLYELLTSTTPIRASDRSAAGYLSLLRAVREDEPPTPSRRYETSGNQARLAAERSTEPHRLRTDLRCDLDWVVMKALEKDRARRYDTVNGLARDVQHYLADAVVEARPPSPGYRLKKFIRRHRVQVVAASLVLGALLAGIVGTTLGLLKAQRSNAIAQTELLEKERARAEEARQRGLADKFRDKALDALRAATGTDVEQLLGAKKELTANEKTYLEAIAKRWQAFAQDEGTDEQSRAIQAEGHFRVAYLWRKLGRSVEARPEYERAVALREQLVSDFPAVPEYRKLLATSHSNLGNLLIALGQWPLAEKHLRKGLTLREKLVEDFADVPEYHQDLAISHTNLGNLLTELNQRPEAEEQFRKSLSRLDKLATDFPDVPEYRKLLATSHTNFGILLSRLKLHPEALKQFRKGLALREQLASDFPNVPEYRHDVATNQTNLGVTLRGLSQWPEAEVEYRKALATLEKLTADFPTVPQYGQDLAMCHNNFGVLLMERDQRSEAENQFRKSLAIREKLAADFPNVPQYQVDCGVSSCNIGNVLRSGDKPAESLEWYRQAIDSLKSVHEKEPSDVTVNQFLRNSYWGRAEAYDALEKPTEALKDWDKVIQLSTNEEQPSFRLGRATSQAKAGLVSEAVTEAAELTKQPNWDGEEWSSFARIYAIASRKIAEKQSEYADLAMESLAKAVKGGWKDLTRIKKDVDFDPIRDRQDYKKLMAQWEK